MVNNIPVNGWPQLKDLEAVQPILNRLDKIEAWKRTVKEETFTGEEITIPNALALPARSLKTTINAIQDLHGYDHPWVGGASKQLIPMTVSGIKALNTIGTWSGNAYTIDTVTITILTDNGNNVIGINVNGTENARVDFILGNIKLNGQYAISGSTNGSTSKWLLWVRGHGTVSEEMSMDGPGYFSDYSEDNRDVILTVFANASPSNQKFYPMLCYRTATDPTTFAPYSNLCPISGRTAVAVDDTGLNLFDKSNIVENYRLAADGGFYPETGYYISPAINVVVGETYTKNSPTADAFHRYCTYDADNNVVRASTNNTITIQAPEKIIRFCGLLTEVNTAQFEVGSTATSYVPYAHSSATIQLGTTVYGADINWDTGVGTVTHAYITLDGNAEANYGFQNFWESSTTWTKYMGRTQRNIGNALEPSSTTASVVISDKFHSASDDTRSEANSISASPTFVDAIYINFGADSGLDTTAKQLAWLAQNPVEICYKLATPTTIQLTPTQLELLKGYNHITLTDGYGTIELKALTGANWS